jgi:hypothetical protein
MPSAAGSVNSWWRDLILRRIDPRASRLLAPPNRRKRVRKAKEQETEYDLNRCSGCHHPVHGAQQAESLVLLVDLGNQERGGQDPRQGVEKDVKWCRSKFPSRFSNRSLLRFFARMRDVVVGDHVKSMISPLCSPEPRTCTPPIVFLMMSVATTEPEKLAWPPRRSPPIFRLRTVSMTLT